MRRIRYRGELFEEGRPGPHLAALLASRDTLVEISNDEPTHDVVIGAPHHAPLGTPRIAEKSSRPRVADEGAALVALATHDALRKRGIASRLLIAVHATDHDPNKQLASPYCRDLFARPAKLLVECHGASANRSNELELTSGMNRLSRPREFGALLSGALDSRYALAAQHTPGGREAMIFESGGQRTQGALALPALKTQSLAEAMNRSMHALHLEATPRFRTSWRNPNTLTRNGQELATAVADAIADYLDAFVR